jgi:hypothetical protein
MSELIVKNANDELSNQNVAYIKAEIEVLMEAAKHDRRDIKSFMSEAIALATYSEEIAASCIYSLPRKQKNEKTGKYEQIYIKGKSIRLAEIIFSVYKNIKVDARISSIGAKSVTAIASCIDLQNKTFFSEEAIADIKGTHGDAVKLAIGIAKSFAIRNTIFRLIPGAMADEIYRHAVECAVGNQKTFPEKRKLIFERISKLGISQEKIFAFYEKTCIEDFTPDNMEEIVGIGSAIKGGELKIDKAFVRAATADEASESVNELIATKKNNIVVEKKPESKKEADVINTETGEFLQPQAAKVYHTVLRKQLENAKSIDTLDIAADLIKDVAQEVQEELKEIYHRRRLEMTNVS